MFNFFNRVDKLKSLRERIVQLEVDYDGLKRKIDNIDESETHTHTQKKKDNIGLVMIHNC